VTGCCLLLVVCHVLPVAGCVTCVPFDWLCDTLPVAGCVTCGWLCDTLPVIGSVTHVTCDLLRDTCYP